jgi:hypothetical protein
MPSSSGAAPLLPFFPYNNRKQNEWLHAETKEKRKIAK